MSPTLLPNTGFTTHRIAVLWSGGASKTTELNLLANCVSRALLYGTKRDKDAIADHVDRIADTFPRSAHPYLGPYLSLEAHI
jgi:hypothetical protein